LFRGSLADFITDTIRVVTFVVEDDDTAYTIFETLNDRGLELSPLDLIKNYMFSKAEKHRPGSLREFEDRWSEMITTLGNAKADSFLRAYWISKSGKYLPHEVFKKFKENYAEPIDTYNASVEMLDASEKYAALSNPNAKLWNKYSEKSRATIEALNIINPTQMHPILIAALDNFEQKEIEKLLRLLEVIAVRYQTVGQGRPGRIESLGGKLAVQIRAKKVLDTQGVKSELSELYIDDKTFKQKFARIEITDGKKARYLLQRLERQSILKYGSALPDELSPSNSTLEHILPKRPGQEWHAEISADPNLLKDCLHRVGNMCLLPEVNKALGNKSFNDKKITYKKSRQRLTNRLDQFSQWRRDEIERRQSWMADLAIAEWRFD
jgi:hypothetical protein